MQTAYSFFEGSVRKTSGTNIPKIKMRTRDIEILKFLLEMKFSTLEELHRKFFRETRDGIESTSLRWARERLALLIGAGFVKTETQIFKKTLYLATQRSYLYLKNSFPEQEFCRPTGEIDKYTLDHDLTVLRLRLDLEGNNQVSTWTSEKYLIDNNQSYSGFTSDFRPDGIYLSTDQKRIALELELSRKGKKRYQEKIKRYTQMLLSPHADKVFESVHYICRDSSTLEIIRSETTLFQPLFKFSLLSELSTSGMV